MSSNDARQKTIMVVDDAEDIRELITTYLTHLGYSVIEAANGFEAVEAVSKECPDLILMDISMPIIDGLEATRMIRRMAEICSVVIIAFTALHSVDSRAKALAAGCDDYVQKPISMGQLSSILNQHLQG